MKLRPLSSNKVMKILIKLDFIHVRTTGSHFVFKHPDGRVIVIPAHKGELIGRGLLRKIIRDTKLSKEDFMKYT
jgi:predicted RNA binding protein YcfA (HicA-like mRNA interferase family)